MVGMCVKEESNKISASKSDSWDRILDETLIIKERVIACEEWIEQ